MHVETGGGHHGKKGLLIIFILGIINLTACSSEEGRQQESIQQILETDNSCTFDVNKIKQSCVGINGDDIIPDKTIALEYSNMILEKVLKKDINEYKEVDINYDSKKGVWILTYGLGKEILGGILILP